MVRKRSTSTALRTVHAVAISILASGANAEDFSWQLSGAYGETELAPFADTERTMLDATYYIDPVDDARGPYALAPFLNRSSRVTFGVTNEKTTITTPVVSIGLPPPGSPTTMDVTEETTGYAIGGRYVWSASGWYVGAGYRDADTDREPSSPESRQGTTTDDYQLFGGRYFGESTSLDLAAGATRQTTQLTITCVTSLCLSGSAATQIDTDDWSIGALHVRQGSRLGYSISGRVSGADVTASYDSLVLTLPPGTLLPPAPATTGLRGIIGAVSVAPFSIAGPFTGSLAIPDERVTYSIGGELFPTDRLGFRIGLARSDGDFVDDESYDLAATWFFTRAAAVQFVLARTQSQLASLRRDIDTAELRLFGRL
jgi:hypothetical protein